MSTAVTDRNALVLATFNLTAAHIAWLEKEAKRRASERPGTRPNRSDIAREVFEKAMRESEEGRAA